MRKKTILLLGGGHSHALLLKHWQPKPAVYETILVSEARHMLYSGMVPGWLAGHYQQPDLKINLPKLCQQAGARFVAAKVKAIDVNARQVTTDKGKFVYSLASLNLGISTSLPPGPLLNGYDIPLKPMTALAQQTTHFFSACEAVNDEGFPIAVVGGGAGGLEVACALAWRLRDYLQIDVALVCDTFLAEYDDKTRQLARDALKMANVALVERFKVVKRTKGTLLSAKGQSLSARYAFWCTSGRAPQLLRNSGLDLDASGFVKVNAYLQSLSHPAIFAVGDLASLTPQPVPRAGVYAVRQAPYLIENLLALANNNRHNTLSLKPYQPQKHYLTLLSLGEKRALAHKWQWRMVGRLIWHWKNYVDRAFVRQFDVP